MYQKIIAKIIELSESLPEISGHTLDIGIRKKYLTQKDIEIENGLTDLIKTFPGEHSVYAEELHDTFIEKENVWIIDPISNTKNFIHGVSFFSIVLSHLYKGEIKFAVIYDPIKKELFTAEKGKGAFLNNQKIQVSNCQKNLSVIVDSPYGEFKKRSLKTIEALVKGDENYIRIFGSYGLHYAYVACGRADVAISSNNKDTFPEFAGKLLVEEAGGKFTDLKGGELTVKTEGIIASNGVVYEQIKKLIDSVV